MVLTVAMVSGICLIAFANGPKESTQFLLLKVATCVDKPSPTLAFIAKNTGSRPIETTPMCTNYNRLIVTLPTGEVEEVFSWKKGIAPVLVAPKETRVWYVENLSDLIKMKVDGVYGVRWKVGETISEEHFLLKGENVDLKEATP